jgi:hypothetical protein
MRGILVQCGRDRGRRVRGGLGDECGGIERRGEIEVVAVGFFRFWLRPWLQGQRCLR